MLDDFVWFHLSEVITNQTASLQSSHLHDFLLMKRSNAPQDASYQEIQKNFSFSEWIDFQFGEYAHESRYTTRQSSQVFLFLYPIIQIVVVQCRLLSL